MTTPVPWKFPRQIPPLPIGDPPTERRRPPREGDDGEDRKCPGCGLPLWKHPGYLPCRKSGINVQ